MYGPMELFENVCFLASTSAGAVYGTMAGSVQAAKDLLPLLISPHGWRALYYGQPQLRAATGRAPVAAATPSDEYGTGKANGMAYIGTGYATGKQQSAAPMPTSHPATAAGAMPANLAYARPTQPTQPAQRAQPAQPAQPAQHAQPTQPAAVANKAAVNGSAAQMPPPPPLVQVPLDGTAEPATIVPPSPTAEALGPPKTMVDITNKKKPKHWQSMA